MKKLLPLLLILAVGCNESTENRAERELERVGESVEEGFKETKRDVKEAINDIKEDSTVKKVGNKIKDITD